MKPLPAEGSSSGGNWEPSYNIGFALDKAVVAVGGSEYRRGLAPFLRFDTAQRAMTGCRRWRGGGDGDGGSSDDTAVTGGRCAGKETEKSRRGEGQVAKDDGYP